MNDCLKNTVAASLLSGSAALFGSYAPVATAAAADADVTVTVAMKSYSGHGAYVAAYIVGPDGAYVSTAYVAGAKAKYQRDLQRWSRLMERTGRGIDGTTGASVGSGRSFTTSLSIPRKLMNAGYKLRVETAVENGQYYPDDAVVPLDDAQLGKAAAGTGYVQTLTIKR